MSRRVRIAIIGNCQAQTLTSLAVALDLPVDPIVLPPVYERDKIAQQEVRAAVGACDFVFNQLVSDDFLVDYVRPREIRSAFTDRSFSWPNIYFDGYFPSVGYIYRNDGTKVTGPLSDYHFDAIVRAWAAGMSAEDAWQGLDAGALPGLSPYPVEESLRRLSRREARADLKMAGFLTRHVRHKPLFFTMNHPSNFVILEMLRLMMDAISLKVPSAAAAHAILRDFPYSLDAIRLPYLNYVKQRYLMPTSYGEDIVGRSIENVDGMWAEGRNAQIYDGIELISAYYNVYDSAVDKDVVLHRYD